MLASLAARTVAAASGGGHGHDLLGPGARGQVPARPAPVAVDGQERVLPVVPVGHEHHALGGRHPRLDARGGELAAAVGPGRVVEVDDVGSVPLEDDVYGG